MRPPGAGGIAKGATVNPRNAVVLVVDRLGAGNLGPYGNTWIDTPQFNRLAMESLLCEFALSDCPCLSTAYRAYWHGGHALSPRWRPPRCPACCSSTGCTRRC